MNAAHTGFPVRVHITETHLAGRILKWGANRRGNARADWLIPTCDSNLGDRLIERGDPTDLCGYLGVLLEGESEGVVGRAVHGQQCLAAHGGPLSAHPGHTEDGPVVS